MRTIRRDIVAPLIFSNKHPYILENVRMFCEQNAHFCIMRIMRS